MLLGKTEITAALQHYVIAALQYLEQTVCIAGRGFGTSPSSAALHRSSSPAVLPLPVAQEWPTDRALLSSVHSAGQASSPPAGSHPLSPAHPDPAARAVAAEGARAERYHGLQFGCFAAPETVGEGAASWPDSRRGW